MYNSKKAFTLVEMLVGAAVFAIIAISVFQTYSSFITLIGAGKYKIMAADIANEEFEVVRNLPYSEVGLMSGIPNGVLAATSTVVRDNSTFQIVKTIRNIDDPFDGTIGGTPNDLSPADYKMVEIEVSCPTCKNFEPYSITSRVSPKNLETASTNGALFIRVFDANGNPVPQANVSVTKSSNPSININDVTDNNGLLAIVDAPPGINAYRISVTKPGFTTDRTYATSTGNPNPIKPDATVLIQQVTQISFVIDAISTINISTKDNQCIPIGDIPFKLSGQKLIGINPDVTKFTGNYTTDSSGQKNLNNIEWDTFSLAITGGGYYLAGLNPVMPLLMLPNSNQNIDIILSNDSPRHLLVTVKDGATQLPLSGVKLTLSLGAYSEILQTGRGYLEQTDWVGGSGQTNLTDITMYHSDNGNIENGLPSGEIKLKNSLGHYALSGILTSSIFDTGTSSNFSNILWSPTSEPPQAGPESVKFQTATSKDNTATTTWDYLGPDGTNGTFYSTSDTNINSIHNGDRYFRYKVYLSTLDDNFSPNVASIAVTFTSDCIPPGQALFSNLGAGTYDLKIEKTGYSTQTIPVDVNSSWQSVDINLLP